MNEKNTSEALQVRKAQEGDTRACGELVRSNQDFIYNSIMYIVGHTHVAEDLTQTVFLKALQNIHSFQGRSRFSTWLYSIMINTVRTYWRDSKKNECVSLDRQSAGCFFPNMDELQAAGKNPWERLISKENGQFVRAAIASLRNDYREIVVLRDMEGLSYRDLSGVLQISPGTVKSRLARARKALKQKLQQIMGDDA